MKNGIDEIDRLVEKHAQATYQKYCDALGIVRTNPANERRFVHLMAMGILDAMIERDKKAKSGGEK